ncbi:hypothetical protein [Streptomyces sp. MI02-7b]|nr:hypothetical protein [Streptomyces sp. MI02-7b]MDX3077636.1 hypothetical protein [Streptomyces sp. MI02-7b]
MTAVLVAALSLALWGRAGFLDVVETLRESVTALPMKVDDRPSVTLRRRP